MSKDLVFVNKTNKLLNEIFSVLISWKLKLYKSMWTAIFIWFKVTKYQRSLNLIFLVHVFVLGWLASDVWMGNKDINNS